MSYNIGSCQVSLYQVRSSQVKLGHVKLDPVRCELVKSGCASEIVSSGSDLVKSGLVK